MKIQGLTYFVEDFDYTFGLDSSDSQTFGQQYGHIKFIARCNQNWQCQQVVFFPKTLIQLVWQRPSALVYKMFEEP